MEAYVFSLEFSILWFVNLMLTVNSNFDSRLDNAKLDVSDFSKTVETKIF